jgi:hypothetical protein
MDEFDRASEREQRDRDAAISHVRKTAVELAYAGECYNCREHLDNGVFCDSDCRDDWAKRMEAQRRG